MAEAWHAKWISMQRRRLIFHDLFSHGSFIMVQFSTFCDHEEAFKFLWSRFLTPIPSQKSFEKKTFFFYFGTIQWKKKRFFFSFFSPHLVTLIKPSAAVSLSRAVTFIPTSPFRPRAIKPSLAQKRSFKFVIMWHEDGLERRGHLMLQSDVLMATQALSTGEGQGLKSPQVKTTKMKD